MKLVPMRDSSAAQFLSHAEVPPNKLWRKGDIVIPTADRRVIRVGYKLGVNDAPSMSTPEVQGHIDALIKLAGAKREPWKARRLLERWWAATWLKAQRMGGPERGVHVVGGLLEDPWGQDSSTPFRVISKRNHRVGTYYPPNGNGEDYEDGGLNNAKTVVIVTVACTEFWERFDVMAGDLEKADATK